MIRIHADFNTCDPEGRVVLNTVGALEDIAKQENALSPGMKVVLVVPDDFEVVGELVFDKVWRATPDWTTMVRVEGSDATKAPR